MDGVDFTSVQSEAEIGRVVELARSIWTEYYTPIIGSAQVEYMLTNLQSPSAVRDEMQTGTAYFLIRYNGESVGYLAYRIERPEHRLFLSKIYLLSSLRGQGVGHRALQFVEEETRRLQCPGFYLTVNKNNEAAIKAYTRYGMQNLGPTVADIGGGFVMDDYIFEFKVAEN